MTRPEDTHTRTADDAARFEAMHSDNDCDGRDEWRDDIHDDELHKRWRAAAVSALACAERSKAL